MFHPFKASQEAMSAEFQSRFDNPRNVGDIALFASQNMQDRWYLGGQIVAAKRMVFAGQSWITIGFAGTESHPGASIYLYPATDLVLVKPHGAPQEQSDRSDTLFSLQGWATVNGAYPCRSPYVSEREREGNTLAREAFDDWLYFSRNCLSYALQNDPDNSPLTAAGISIRPSGFIELSQPPQVPSDPVKWLMESFDKAVAKSSEVKASEKAIMEYFNELEATF